ncbi:MAG: putative beta-lysine N-acetyltransferase [Verrucomicrobiota bacterium]|nr:putative beta-lysine N-acetyltransferase [Verrucomicrobiota bacterium]
MYDKLETLACGSEIQHGKYNNRIYLMKVGENVKKTLPNFLIELAEKNNYSKIFAKVSESNVQNFYLNGYKKEAKIPYFYNGKENCLFLAYYLSDTRSVENSLDIIDSNLDIAINKKNNGISKKLPSNFKLCKCIENDVKEMAEIYKKVFQSYPFPIHKPEYLLETMRTNIDYFGIKLNEKLIALSSAEIDVKSSNVEMTDFATLPEYLGNGFAQHLLVEMENEMIKKEIKTAYTIARAMSAGMNITFSKIGYNFAGKLTNNTNISGQIESMNVWYKNLNKITNRST